MNGRNEFEFMLEGRVVRGSVFYAIQDGQHKVTVVYPEKRDDGSLNMTAVYHEGFNQDEAIQKANSAMFAVFGFNLLLHISSNWIKVVSQKEVDGTVYTLSENTRNQLISGKWTNLWTNMFMSDEIRNDIWNSNGQSGYLRDIVIGLVGVDPKTLLNWGFVGVQVSGDESLSSLF